MFGRAGRGGGEAVAQLTYTAKELQAEGNAQLIDFVANQENCRRHSLLRNLGSTESLVGDRTLCCDVCSIGVVPYCKLKFLTKRPIIGRAKRRKVHQTLSPQLLDELKRNLIKEREIITLSSPGFSFLGPDIVCPLPIICQLCKIAKYVKTIDDIKVPGLRPQLYDRFFGVISNVLR